MQPLPTNRWMSLLMLSLVLLASCGTHVPPPVASPAAMQLSSRTAVAPPPAPTEVRPMPTPLVYAGGFSGNVDVGGFQLHLVCAGEGTPTVIMDSGLGGNSTYWAPVFLKVKRVTRACIYDRAGL